MLLSTLNFSLKLTGAESAEADPQMESLEKDSAPYGVNSLIHPNQSLASHCPCPQASRALVQARKGRRAVLADRAVLLSLQMTEGRHCQVHLLDDRNLELLVQVQTSLCWGLAASATFLCFFSFGAEDKFDFFLEKLTGVE